MGKINVLDKFVAELIAAGEVIERPASVVKELVENAIDAGATSITVEIKNGGLKYIRVTDNGSGILSDDVRNAFLRNATSKVKTADDLNKILTLGFRGEALASIAAMCKVELLTRTDNSIEGTRYEISGGEEHFLGTAGCPKGTTIIVRDIFYNTPARMKFLKKDVTEGNMVASVIDKIALSHPFISVKFIRDSQIRLQTAGDGNLLSSIYSVFGKQFSDGLISVDYESDCIAVKGFTCKSEYAKPNRTFQNIYINSRYVKSKTCVAALDEAYKHNIMVGKFPYCVLNISINPGDIDINVHPSKIEVRFFNEKQIFDAVFYACKNAIEAVKTYQPVVSEIKNTKINPFLLEKPPIEPEQQHFSTDEYKNLIHNQAADANNKIDFSYNTKNDNYILSLSDKKSNYQDKAIIEEKTGFPQSKFNITANSINDDTVINNAKNANTKIINTAKPESKNIKIVGEILNTYIILDTGISMILVDKHAAHERIIYEKLKSTHGTDNQQLLLPITVTLSKEDYSALIDNIDSVDDLGFSVEDFGNGTVIVRSAPMYLVSNDIPNIIIEISDKIKNNKKNITPDLLDDLLHSVACRAAIKANDKSSGIELEALNKMLNQNNNLTHCPHGRPIFVELTKYEIEKLFGRLG